MYMSSISPEAVGRIAKRALAGCRKDALISRFSRVSTVAPTVTAHWKANQHRTATVAIAVRSAMPCDNMV